MLAASRIFAYAFLIIGVAILAKTIAIGGGSVGYLAGVVFLALGLVRLRALRP